MLKPAHLLWCHLWFSLLFVVLVLWSPKSLPKPVRKSFFPVFSTSSRVVNSSVAESCLTLQSHELQHARLPCPLPSPKVYSDSCPLSRWCYPTMLSSVIPFSSCLQSFPASGSFPMSQFFASGSRNIGASASASVLQMNSQGWFPLGLTGLISLQTKGLSSFRVSGLMFKSLIHFELIFLSVVVQV